MKPTIQSHPTLLNHLPKGAKILFDIFGDDIRLVGGSVRDLLLGYEVHDFDFATRHLPEKTMDILFQHKIKAIPTGIKFGTITAVIDNQNFEITTLRQDDKTDGRHCEPLFVDDYYEDAKRRDFTINALYLDAKGDVYDYFEGIEDVNNHAVKFIGDANQRIEEDYLRILRFFRFSAKYGDQLDHVGLQASLAQKANLKNLSRERIRAELVKMISDADKEKLCATLQVMKEEGVFDVLFRSFVDVAALSFIVDLHQKYDIRLSFNLQFGALFFTPTLDIKAFAPAICATNIEKKYLQSLQDILAEEILDGFDFIKKQLAFFETDFVLEFYLILLSKAVIDESFEQIQSNINYIHNFTPKPFPLSSQDIINLGFLGPEISTALKKAKLFWAQHNFQNDKESLLAFLKQSDN